MSKRLRRLLSLALIITVPLSSLLLAANAESPDTPIPAATRAELMDAINDSDYGAIVTVELTDNIMFSSEADIIVIPAGKTIKLTGGGIYAIDANRLNRVIEVEQGAELLLENIQITGGRIATGGSGGGIYNSGSLTVGIGATITGNIAFLSGGGVHNAVDALLYVYGGSISGNTAGNTVSGSTPAVVGGGGIYNDGTIYMSYGDISGNIAGNTASGGLTPVTGGGGVYNNGTFYMDAGSIVDNGVRSTAYANGSGGGLYNTGSFAMGAGVLISGNISGSGGVWNSGTFLMSGGEISNHTGMGGGVTNSGTFEMSGGVIQYNYANAGGGVRNYGTFTMSGGKISLNEANPIAGGVYNEGTFILVNGEISDNKSSMVWTVGGGGVYNDGTFTMYDGLITRNPVGNGAVYNGGTFTMDGGAIMDNYVSNLGGGVFNNSNSTFTMNGGEISGNTADLDGGGVYTRGTFDMTGGEIKNNTAGIDGGGVWTSKYENLTVAEAAAFSGNKASAAYSRNPDNDEIYFTNILGNEWTVPFIQGYNNYDINHKYAEPLPETYVVTVNDSYADAGSTGAGSYAEGAEVAINAGSRSGYTFIGWNVDEGDVEIDDPGMSAATFTMPAENVVVTANWRLDEAPKPEETEKPYIPEVTEKPDIPEETEKPDESEPEETEEPGDPGDTEESEEPGDPVESEGPNPPGGTEGSDFPPLPTRPLPPDPPSGNTLVPADDGSFIELDENDTPLGEWLWDEETGTWIFEPYVPLGELPQTGLEEILPVMLALLGVALAVTGTRLRIKNKKRKRAQ